MDRKLSLTAVIEKDPEGWYVGQLEEFPEVVSQGRDLEELEENLIDALNLLMEEHREKTQEQYRGKKTIRRRLTIN